MYKRQIGHCLLELGKPKEALKYYYKVEFLDTKTSRVLRPIAWTSFISGDYERSKSYYERVLLDNPTSADYLNIGHLYLVTGDVREAINFYGLSIDNGNGDTEDFIRNFGNDANVLIKAGVQPKMLPLVVDALLYARD